jgi:hypothetical protein
VALRRGLAEGEFAEDNLVFAARYAGNDVTHLAPLASELSALKPHVIVAAGSRNALVFAQGKVRARIVELHAEIASRSVTAAALTLDGHMEMLRELRDKADQRGQTSAAIRAEELRGQLQRFYVKQVETGDAGDFSRMSDEELRAYVYGEALPPKDPVKH